MNANPVLLQKKYTRIIMLLAKEKGISLHQALSFFYHSELYDLLSEGISDMHCMSDEYLVKDLEREYERCNVFNNTQTNSMEM